MDKVICLAGGSLFGGFARWLVTDGARGAMGSRFPAGTLCVNLAGCLLIGILHGLGDSRLSANGRMLLMVGFCGAFTTFSTWILESSVLLDRGEWRGALAYVMLSVILGFGAFRLGVMGVKTVIAEGPFFASAARHINLTRAKSINEPGAEP